MTFVQEYTLLAVLSVECTVPIDLSHCFEATFQCLIALQRHPGEGYYAGDISQQPSKWKDASGTGSMLLRVS